MEWRLELECKLPEVVVGVLTTPLSGGCRATGESGVAVMTGHMIQMQHNTIESSPTVGTSSPTTGETGKQEPTLQVTIVVTIVCYSLC